MSPVFSQIMSNTGRSGFSSTSGISGLNSHQNKKIIKWSKETINTRPQSIELETTDYDSILLTQEGIYQNEFIMFIPYGMARPVLNLKMDDQVILSTIEGQSNATVTSRQIHFTTYVEAKLNRHRVSI